MVENVKTVAAAATMVLVTVAVKMSVLNVRVRETRPVRTALELAQKGAITAVKL